MERDTGGRGDVQGIERAAHRNADAHIGVRERLLGQPLPFGPEEDRHSADRGGSGDKLPDVRGVRMRRHRQHHEPGSAKGLEGGWPGRGCGTRHHQRGAGRRPQRLAIERVATSRAEQHRLDAEGLGAAKDRANVVGVDHALKYGHERMIVEDGLHRHVGRTQRHRKATAVHVEAGGRGDDLRCGDVDGRAGVEGGQHIAERVQRRLVQQQRLHPEPREFEEAPHNEAPLRNEHPAVTQQRRVADPGIGCQPRVATVVDANHQRSRLAPRRSL